MTLNKVELFERVIYQKKSKFPHLKMQNSVSNFN